MEGKEWKLRVKSENVGSIQKIEDYWKVLMSEPFFLARYFFLFNPQEDNCLFKWIIHHDQCVSSYPPNANANLTFKNLPVFHEYHGEVSHPCPTL